MERTSDFYTWKNIFHDCFWVGRGFWLIAAILTAIYIMSAGLDGNTLWGSFWCYLSGMCLCRYLHIAFQPQANKPRIPEPKVID